jgi:hypothetical protein
VQSDEEFCNQYNGVEGGLISSNIAIYPFMNQIKRNLYHAAGLPFPVTDDNYETNMGKTAAPSPSLAKLSIDRSFASKTEDKLLSNENIPHSETREHQNNEDGTKFTLYSGHDTVIAPVLAALGVYDRFCVWPPYASRIAFELWESLRTPMVRKHDCGDANCGYSSVRFNKTIDRFYVRVIFNGEDVTRYIPACAEHTARVRSNLGARLKSQRSLVDVSGDEGITDESEEDNQDGHADSRRLDELSVASHVQYRKTYYYDKYDGDYFDRRMDGDHLCSLEAFGRQIESLLGGASSMTEACSKGGQSTSAHH